MKNNTKLNITDWALSDRPREKMMISGSKVLSDAELLAILIGSGNKDENAVELMRRILSACNNDLNALAKWNLNDFTQYKGLGIAKSISIMAALELGRRRKLNDSKTKSKITCSNDIYEFFNTTMADLPEEEFWILLLNQAGFIIDKIQISKGGIDGTYADVRSILREALLKRATQLALIHNHPSGNAQPSRQDIQLTNTIQKATITMNIRLIDHVIICETSYYSFADEGLLQY